MSNIIEFPARPIADAIAIDDVLKFYAPRWRCYTHGDHDQVVHIATLDGARRTFCVLCIVEALERIGLTNLEMVDRG